METYSANGKVVQLRRRKTRRQLVSHAIRQAKRLGEGDLTIGWSAGIKIGESLADATMLRKLTGEERNGIGFWLFDLLHDVLDLTSCHADEDENIRHAIVAGVCREFDTIVKWAYERGAFRFNIDDEGEMMKRGTRSAARIAANVKGSRQAAA